MAEIAPAVAAGGEKKFGGLKLLAGYVAVGAVLAAAATVSITIGHGLHAPPDIAGTYTGTASTCLGKSFTLTQSGRYVSIAGAGKVGGNLEANGGRLHGTVTCSAGAATAIDLTIAKSGTALTGSV